MKIAILNNAANYLNFNVNFAKYLEKFNYQVVFPNADKFIGKQIRKNDLITEKYPKIQKITNYYNKNSNIIKYLKRLYDLPRTEKLIKLKNKEYYQAFEYFKNNRFDYVLILNGAFNVETDVCKELNIKTFFFEHAYIPKAIQMDPKGVNSDASFADLTYNELLKFEYKKNEFNPLTDFVFTDIRYKMIERYLYRLTDIGYNSFIRKYISRKLNLKKASKRFKSFSAEHIELKENEKYILFPLQVNSDTQIILNSPYKSMYEAIEDILPELKKTGLKIIIKEHPMEVEPVDYSKYDDGEQVFVVKKIDLNKYSEKAEFVVNINSSVGFQAIAKYKKVLLLGKSFYKNSPLAIEYKNITDTILSDVFSGLKINKTVIDKYINHFREEIFIQGHFYTPDINFFERIRNRML